MGVDSKTCKGQGFVTFFFEGKDTSRALINRLKGWVGIIFKISWVDIWVESKDAKLYI